MNKVIKVAGIIGGALFLVGIIIFLISFSVLGFDYRKLNVNYDYTQVTEEFMADNIKIIETDLLNKRVIIRPSSGDKIRVSYYESEYDTFTCTKQDNTIYLKNNNRIRDWFRQFKFGFFSGISQIGTQEVVIDVPDYFAGEILISTSNASVTVKDLELLTIVEIDTANGSINLSDLTCEKVELKTSNAKINIDNLRVSGDITAKTANGKIEILKTQAVEMDLKTSNGSIDLDEIVGYDKISAQSSNASIRVKRIVSDDIYLKTSNGSIQGTIAGREQDYRIKSDTSNAKNNLPDNWGKGEKKLGVYTSNSSIDIEFTE